MSADDAEIARLQRRVREDPRSTAFVALAEALRRDGRHTEALAVLREGGKSRPDLASARVVLARINLDLGDRSTAEDVLADVVRVDPENLAATALLAGLYAEEGRVREAQPLIERLRMSGGQDADLAEIVARLNARARHIPSGRDPFASPALAERLAERGAWRAALRVWRDIEAVAPDHIVVRTQIMALEHQISKLSARREPGFSGGPLPRTGAARALRAWVDRIGRYT